MTNGEICYSQFIPLVTTSPIYTKQLVKSYKIAQLIANFVSTLI